jgi:hypothetical protein
VTGFLLVRGDDLLVVGVRWSGFDISAPGSAATLTAGPNARLVLVLPPQHIGEEASPPGSAAPLSLPAGQSGTTVPVWRGMLSATSRLAFTVSPGTQIPLTAVGVLGAAASATLTNPNGVPGPDDTAIELPWRVVLAPRGRNGAGKVACRHPATPVDPTVSGLWRTRLVDASAPAGATLIDAGLQASVADNDTANGSDPEFPDTSGTLRPIRIPLDLQGRQDLSKATQTAFAPVSRLELSALGGTLNAKAVFPEFEWEHRAVLGRDMYVKTLNKGVMYPLGHRAELLQVAQRIYDPAAGDAAVLRETAILTIIEPTRTAPAADGPVRRGFPLGEVTITQTVFNVDDPQNLWKKFTKTGELTYFSPAIAGVAVQFPLSCNSDSGVVTMHVPLMFVADLGSLTDPALATQLAADYGSAAPTGLAPTNIDLVGPARPAGAAAQPADVHEVHALSIAGVTAGLDLSDGYRCQLSSLQIALPALRTLLGDTRNLPAGIPPPTFPVAFADRYLQHGASEDVLLDMVQDSVGINFSSVADRSGGVLAPVYSTDAISRSLGPIAKSAIPDPVTGILGPEKDPNKLFNDLSATLLGVPLKDLLSELNVPPQITSIPLPTSAPQVQMSWSNVQIKSTGPVVATPTTMLDHLTVTVAPGQNKTDCLVRDIHLELPPGADAVLGLTFPTIAFTQSGGQSPHFEVAGVVAKFLGDLNLLEKLEEAVDLDSAGKLLDVTPDGIVVHFALPIPSIGAGAFVMSNLAFNAQIKVPFTPVPMSIVLGFAARANPFTLAVMMFGGTGYIELELNCHGIQRFEAALEFGAFVALDFGVAAGEVHALGGVRFVLESSGTVTITGYLRIGGSLEILGLVSVSIELCLSLTYQSQRKALVGRATLVIEIDLTLWSTSVELDSGEWVLAGGGDSAPLPPHPAHPLAAFAHLDAPTPPVTDPLALFKTYRYAFADVEHPNPVPTSPDAAPALGGNDE